MLQNLKYLAAYLLPVSAWLGLHYGGYYSFGSLYLAFVILPIFELMFSGTDANNSDEQEAKLLTTRLFDILLYLNVPILYGLIGYFFFLSANANLTPLEQIGGVVNLGILTGALGINVAHELGHRATRYEQILAQILLLPALYMHFFVEHNRGHHKNVATDADPASARFGESVYAFWWRSVSGSWLGAWQLEADRCQKEGKNAHSFQNLMWQFVAFQTGWLIAIACIFGWWTSVLAIGVAIIAFLLLETVNYIEHYGLRRQQLPNGRYEAVAPHHSWNSNHDLGRIFLYELTRHSDHHYRANRKYQILRHHHQSPQLPLGYPASMLMALLPPLWYRVMNSKIEPLLQQQQPQR